MVGASIQAFLKALENKDGLPTDERDWSVEAAHHLALAYHAMEMLSQAGVSLRVGGSDLLGPSLERAWREVLYIRPRVPFEMMTGDVYRDVTLSKQGRILYGVDHSSAAYRRPDSDLEGHSHHE